MTRPQITPLTAAGAEALRTGLDRIAAEVLLSDLGPHEVLCRAVAVIGAEPVARLLGDATAATLLAPDLGAVSPGCRVILRRQIAELSDTRAATLAPVATALLALDRALREGGR